MAYELQYFILGLVPFLMLIGFRAKVYLERNHVWYDMHLNDGRTISRHAQPDGDGALHLPEGKFFTRPDAFKMIKPYWMSSQERRNFLFDQTNPFPIRLGHKMELRRLKKFRKVQKFSANPGELVEVEEPYEEDEVYYVPIPEHSVIPPRALEVLEKQHVFSDIYQRQIGLLILIIIGFVVLALFILGLYAR